MIREKINKHLDTLAKLYELWSLEEIQLSKADITFLEALSDVVYSTDDPHEYVFTTTQKAKLGKMWENYERRIRELPK